MGELVPAIVGEVVILLVVLGVIWLVLRELVRIALKVIAVVAVVVAVALWLGFLDSTFVADKLAAVGDWVMTMVGSAVDWVVMATMAA